MHAVMQEQCVYMGTWTHCAWMHAHHNWNVDSTFFPDVQVFCWAWCFSCTLKIRDISGDSFSQRQVIKNGNCHWKMGGVWSPYSKKEFFVNHIFINNTYRKSVWHLFQVHRKVVHNNYKTAALFFFLSNLLYLKLPLLIEVLSPVVWNCSLLFAF